MSRAVLKGNTFKYGMPLYGLAWPSGDTFVLCGGGGNGIKNRIICAESKQGQLSDVISECLLNDDCPMRLAVSPDGKSIVLCMGKGGIKRVDVDLSGPKFSPMALPPSPELSNIGTGEVKSLAFSHNGKVLALGLASGEVYVLDWPSLAGRFSLRGDHKLADAVRDIDFSSKANLLALTLDNGTAEVWDWENKVLVCRMEPGKAKQNLERFMSLGNGTQTVAQPLPEGIERVLISKIRFARDETGEVITLLKTGAGSAVARWSCPPQSPGGDRGLLSYVSSKHISSQPCTCFETSPDGQLLAFGTSEGGVVVTTAVNYSKVAQAAKAHMVFSTGIMFARDTPPAADQDTPIKSYRVISVSADASARLVEVPFQTALSAASSKGSLPPFLLLILLVLFAAVLILGITQYSEFKAMFIGKEEL